MDVHNYSYYGLLCVLENVYISTLLVCVEKKNHIQNRLLYCTCACYLHPQGSTVNMNVNQRMYDNAFSGINNKPQRLGVVLLVGELTNCASIVEIIIYDAWGGGGMNWFM